MKLDLSHLRYLSDDDFCVLKAVECGSKNHELVPTQLIERLTARGKKIHFTKNISTLAKFNLISRIRNSKYDGYKLTYKGHDYLAMNEMILRRKTFEHLGTIVGMGKESDIYLVKDSEGIEKILKIHRLGRISFRSIKNKRDYLKKNESKSWMYLSRISAHKEYQFLSTLYNTGFKVPKVYDYSRHCILMEKIPGVPMTKLYEKDHVEYLYSELMKFIVSLGNHGLIHCDFNEFNIMAINDGEDFSVLDFPQSVSIDHINAEFYFQRDIDCVKLFFKNRFNYVPKKNSIMEDTDGYGNGYKYTEPDFKRDVKRCDELDFLLQASGFKRKKLGKAYALDDEEQERNDFESSMDKYRARLLEDDYGDDYDSEDYDSEDYESEVDDSNDIDDEEQNERIIEALQNGMENLKMDKLGNYILE